MPYHNCWINSALDYIFIFLVIDFVINVIFYSTSQSVSAPHGIILEKRCFLCSFFSCGSTMESSCQNELRYLTPLFIISKCFGVTAISLQYNKPVHIVWKVYSTLLASAVLLFYLFNLIYKVAFFAYNENPFLIFIDMLCEMCLIVSDIATLTHVIFTNGKLASTFVEMISRDDKCFRTKNNYKRRQGIFLAEFLLVFVCVVLYQAYNFYVFVFTIPFIPGTYVFFREISVYLIAITLLQLYNFVFIIRNKFVLLNRSMRKELYSQRKVVVIGCEYSVDVYLDKYVEYCDLVEMFGKIFGRRIFWILSFIIIETVEGFQIGLNCFAHISLQRVGDDNCSYVGIANLLEVSIYVVKLLFFIYLIHIHT